MDKIVKYVLIILFLAGCTGNGSLDIDKLHKKGSIRFVLTDYPLNGSDVQNVYVNITALKAKKKHGNDIVLVSFPNGGLVVDLLHLQNGNTLDLGQIDLEEGEYKKLRLVLGDQNSVVVDEGAGYTTKPLYIKDPHKELKISDKFDIEDEGDTVLLIDFDVQKSVKYKNAKYWLLPNIKIKKLDTNQNFFTLTPRQINMEPYIPPLPPNATRSDELALGGLTVFYSLQAGAGSQMNTDITVLGVCPGPYNKTKCLTADTEVDIGANVTGGSAYTIKANRVNVGAGTILGTAEFNTLNKDPSASFASTITPLGQLPRLPDFLTGFERDEEKQKTVQSPLPEGVYHKLNIKDGETFVLLEGVFYFSDVHLGDNATLSCQGACTVIIEEHIKAGIGARITSSLGEASAMNIYIGEIDTDNEKEKDDRPEEHEPDDIEFEKTRFDTGAQITANIYAPFTDFIMADSGSFTGSLIASRAIFGANCQFTGTEPMLVLTKEYITQGVYQNEALQFDFLDASTLKMLGSANPQYVYHGTYHFDLATQTILIQYTTVDLIDPNCIPCQSSGYPPITTYPADQFLIPDAWTGFQIVDWNRTSMNATVLSDGTTISFSGRNGFGPYDE